MIVMTIIALLAMIAIPAFQKAMWSSANARYASDVRSAAGAFEMYSLEHGKYPDDTTPSVVPAGMSPYLEGLHWQEETSVGGKWDWDNGQFGYAAGVSVYRPSATEKQMRQLDKVIDDGNLASGIFRARADGYIYIIEY